MLSKCVVQKWMYGRQKRSMGIESGIKDSKFFIVLMGPYIKIKVCACFFAINHIALNNTIKIFL